MFSFCFGCLLWRFVPRPLKIRCDMGFFHRGKIALLRWGLVFTASRKREGCWNCFWVKGDCGDRSNILLLSTFLFNCYSLRFDLEIFGSEHSWAMWAASFPWVLHSVGVAAVIKRSRIPLLPRQGEESLFKDPAFNGDVAIGSCDVQGWRKPFKWIRAKQLHKMLVAIKTIFWVDCWATTCSWVDRW